MLVRDAGDAWQIVLQTDHAELSGQLLAAWGGAGFRRPEPHASVVRAARRHDDGWATWERAPRLDPDRGVPVGFTEVPVPVHLAFYRAGVEVVCAEDAYAGMLVSMHLTGLYRARYGVVPARPRRLGAAERALVDRFCAEEEARQADLARQLGAPEAERWRNYALLQVADLLSLHCGLAPLERPGAGGDARGVVEDVPTADGGRCRIELQPLGPWRLRFDPYPFAVEPLELTMARRLVRKREWADDDEFRADLAAAPVEQVRIVVRR